MPSKTFTIKNFEISSLNDFLKAIIKDKTILEFKDVYGSDAYLLASCYGHLEIMKYLENEHNWDIHVKDDYGNDAYLLAAINGHLEIMKYLENEHNWDMFVRNKYDENAAGFALKYYHLEIGKHLNKLYTKQKEEKRILNLQKNLKLEKEKNFKLEEELKQIKEKIKNFFSLKK